MQPSDPDLEAVLGLNDRMNAEERRGTAGVEFFRTLLDQSLRFRRASGAIVTRDEFLIDLANPTNTRDVIEPVGPVDCQVYENTAVVVVLLRVVGSNGSNPLDGRFRNIRIFRRADSASPWRLHIWFNDSVSAGGTA